MRVGVSNKNLDWHGVKVGDALPPMVIDLTATRIVAGAIATRDFMPVHHDRSYANSQGAPDIFMNILSDTGYASRFLTDWAGPGAMLKKLAIRLGIPAFPGQTLSYTGRVTATKETADSGIVELEFKVTSELGDHLSGTAVLDLPLTRSHA